MAWLPRGTTSNMFAQLSARPNSQSTQSKGSLREARLPGVWTWGSRPNRDVPEEEETERRREEEVPGILLPPLPVFSPPAQFCIRQSKDREGTLRHFLLATGGNLACTSVCVCVCMHEHPTNQSKKLRKLTSFTSPALFQAAVQQSPSCLSWLSWGNLRRQPG